MVGRFGAAVNPPARPRLTAVLVDRLAEGVLAWLAPRRCAWCQGRIARGHSCAECRARLPWNRLACPRCALPLDAARSCPQCVRAPPPQDAAIAALRYASPVDARILALKFHGSLGAAAPLAELLAQVLAVRPEPLPELLVPVPLHRLRMARRGYNQALEIARPLARRLSLRCDPFAVRRVRATAEQTRLDAGQRHRNLRGAFVASPRLAGRTVALLDDVITTGATAAEIARAVRAAGAARIEVWAVARASLRRKTVPMAADGSS